MKKVLFTGFFALILSLFALATHNRAGEITYRRINGLTYEVTITTYTKESSPADRCELEIFWGDGESDTLLRSNGGPGGDCDHYGEVLTPLDVKKNIYIGIHTYAGPGTYEIYFEDANRNASIKNIPNSVNQPFYVLTTLYVNPFMGTNNTPVLLNPPIDEACVGQPFVHNPGAFDAEGDSISYGLTNCRGLNGQFISGYFIPQGVQINAVTGDLTWIPNEIGEFNFAIEIFEWRNGSLIGKVIRDMQVTVGSCNNDPPEIETEDEICVEAGDTVSFLVVATDPNPGHEVTLTATGGPLVAPNNASFVQPVGGNPVTSQFNWITACSHVRLQAHQVFFRAVDNGNPNLVDYHTTNIYVVGPSPKNPQAVPAGNTITVSWDASICSEVVGYKIYRRSGYYGFFPDTCETGVPAYTGYTLIGTTEGLNSTSFTDNNNGAGLLRGNDYCYMIVACFPDGAESYASLEVCAELKKDIPIITHVDVTSTSTTGGIFVDWVKPTELDTTEITGPYEYRLYRSAGSSFGNETLINTYSANLLSQLDTFYVDTPINTEANQYHYRVELYNATPGDEFEVGFTEASSIRLAIAETDRQLILNWQANVPWTNYKYRIYKLNDVSQLYELLDSTTTTTYTDTGLINGLTYCYYIEAEGEYTGDSLPSPLFNKSQIECGVPIDTIPPCPPTLSVFPNCDEAQNLLTWDLPSGSCDDDAIEYHIYYTPTLGGDMELIATITNMLDTSYLHSELLSIAGCYALTSMDSVFNESPITDTICVENCPEYELPNVFTPNGDGSNDVFHPFPYKYVKDVDIKIYNRWGNLVFETTDPDVGWDGTNKLTKLDCSDGVYYYVCQVNEIYLAGVQPRTIKGFVQLIRGE